MNLSYPVNLAGTTDNSRPSRFNRCGPIRQFRQAQRLSKGVATILEECRYPKAYFDLHVYLVLFALFYQMYPGQLESKPHLRKQGRSESQFCYSPFPYVRCRIKEAQQSNGLRRSSSSSTTPTFQGGGDNQMSRRASARYQGNPPSFQIPETCGGGVHVCVGVSGPVATFSRTGVCERDWLSFLNRGPLEGEIRANRANKVDSSSLHIVITSEELPRYRSPPKFHHLSRRLG